jgi:hypothetical protein
MVAVPTDNAEIWPLALTVATEVLLLDHAMLRPRRAIPDASLAMPSACAAPPTSTLDGLIVTDIVATGTTGTLAGATVSGAEAVFPSLLAVMFAFPAPTELTRPVLFTVATEVFEEDHATARPVNT